MRQIRQTLRLHLEAGLSYAQIGPRRSASARRTVGKIICCWRAPPAWTGPRAQTLTDEELEARLYRPPVPRASRQLEPDYAWSTRSSSAPASRCNCSGRSTSAASRGGQPAYKYTSFCVKYRAWAAGLKRSMRQTHVAGERLFVDYAGQTVPIIDAATGEIRRAQIFVAVLGASNYTYACATATQTARRLGRRDHRRAGVHRRRAAADRSRPDPGPDRAARPLRAEPPTAWSTNCARTTTWRCSRRARRIRATSPRSKSACRSSSAGSSRDCATGASSAWPN